MVPRYVELDGLGPRVGDELAEQIFLTGVTKLFFNILYPGLFI